MKPDISLVFVAYNEKDNIEHCLQTALKVAKTFAHKYEAIAVVYEGSTDGTIEIVNRLAKNNKRIRLIIQTKERKGVGQAYAIGIESARFPYVFYSDADNQFDFSEIRRLIPYINNDIVAGYRVDRADPFGRIAASWVYNQMIRILFGMTEKDFDCAFRIVNKDSLSRLNLKTSTGFLAPEMMIKAHYSGMRIKQVGVHHYPRESGDTIFQSEFLSVPKPSIVINQIRELWRVWREVILRL